MIRRKISLLRTRMSVSNRDFGPGHTLSRMFLDGIVSWFFVRRQYIIYEKRLTGSESPPLRNPGLEFKFISTDDSSFLEQIEKLSGLSREMVREKIDGGGECLIARDNGRLAGFNLVSAGKAHVRYIDAYLDLSSTEAWSEQITVAPEYRQGGLATDIRHLMFAKLSGKGYEKLIGGYVPFNVKSGGLAKKLGFIELEKVTLTKVFSWKKLASKTLSPELAGKLALAFQ